MRIIALDLEKLFLKDHSFKLINIARLRIILKAFTII